MAVNQHLSRGFSKSRADVADYIIKHLEDSATYCSMIEQAY